LSQMSQDSVGSVESGFVEGAVGRDLEWLAAAVAGNAASPLFPALAETYRRMGRLDAARRVAEAGLEGAPDNTAGRVALALTLLDLGEVEGAHEQLSGALQSLQVGAALVPQTKPAEPPAVDEATDLTPEASLAADAELEDVEIDRAFESAEAQPDEMVDANKVVEEALRREDLHEPEVDLSPLSASPTFATRTMANLLELQGDRAGADAIRSALALDASGEIDAAEVPKAPEVGVLSDVVSGRGPVERARVLSTLENWLQNIRRGVA
jgi:hypothetical protein